MDLVGAITVGFQIDDLFVTLTCAVSSLNYGRGMGSWNTVIYRVRSFPSNLILWGRSNHSGAFILVESYMNFSAY